MVTKMGPKVSIIIPSFNLIDYLKLAIESVICQTYQNWELLVIDDASTDGTQEYLRSLSDLRIKAISLPRNSGGPAHPRNVGLQHASGEYIAFLDADDLWLPQKLELQIKYLLNSGDDFCSTRVRSFKEQVPDLNEVKPLDDGARSLTFTQLLRKNRVKTSTVVLKATQRITFSEHSHHKAIEDYLAWLNLFEDGEYRGAVLQCQTALYRIHGASISRSKFIMAKKIFRMLGEQRFNGHYLGLKKYYYFFTYVVYSIWNQEA